MTTQQGAQLSFRKPPDRLPRFVWLGLLPILLLAFTAVFLHEHWSAIPPQFPVHSEFDGVVDRWAERSVRSVYGPLLFGVEMCCWFMLVAVWSSLSARNSSIHGGVLGMFIAVESMLALLFSALALQPLLKFPMIVFVGIVVAIPVILLIFMLLKKDQGSDPSPVRPSECWKAGFVYYNPNDTDLLVEKRLGMGYTFNFANPKSWVLMALLAIIVATAPWLFG